MKKIILLFSLCFSLFSCGSSEEAKWEFVGTRQCVLTQLNPNAMEDFFNGNPSSKEYSVYLDLYKIEKDDGWVYGLKNDEGIIYTEEFPIPVKYEPELRILNFRYDGVVYSIADYRRVL